MENERSNGRALASIPEPGRGNKQEIFAKSPLAGLPGELGEELLGMATLEHLPRRYAITTQGEPTRNFVLIGAGRVKLERISGDRALALGHRGPGHVVGESALAGAPAATETASVVDEVTALAIPMPALRDRLAADAPLCASMLAMVVHQHRELEQRLMGLLLYGVESRLSSFILDAAQRWGRPHEAGEIVTAPFTHAEIALLIGSTRETVTLVLGKLKREGVLGFDHRRVVIRDRALLEQRAAATTS